MIIYNPKDTVAVIVVFLLPLMLVKAGAVVFGGGAAMADGSTGTIVTTPQGIPTLQPPEWTPEQDAAAAHISHLNTQPFGRSPFFHAKDVAPDIPDVENPFVPRREVRPPNVVVQVILMRSDGNHVALIDRRRYRVGDALGEDGWVISKIDGRSRSVEIEHAETGGTETLFVPLPR